MVSAYKLKQSKRLLKLISERGYINTHMMLSMANKKTSKDFVNNIDIENEMYRKYIPVALFEK